MSDSFNEKACRGVARRGGLSVSLWSANHSRDGGAVVIPERFSARLSHAGRSVSSMARRLQVRSFPVFQSNARSVLTRHARRRPNLITARWVIEGVGFVVSLMNVTPRFVTPEMGITAPCLQQQTRQEKANTRGCQRRKAVPPPCRIPPYTESGSIPIFKLCALR